MGHGRADEAGPLLAGDVEEASAGNRQAQSSVPTFLKLRKYYVFFRAQTQAFVCTHFTPFKFSDFEEELVFAFQELSFP